MLAEANSPLESYRVDTSTKNEHEFHELSRISL
jgi:hypothetical protein